MVKRSATSRLNEAIWKERVRACTRIFGAISNCFFSVCEVATVRVDLFPACIAARETEGADIWPGNAPRDREIPCLFCRAYVHHMVRYIFPVSMRMYTLRDNFIARRRRNAIYALAFLIFTKCRFLVAKRYVTSIFTSYVSISKSYDCVSIVRCAFKREVLHLLTVCLSSIYFIRKCNCYLILFLFSLSTGILKNIYNNSLFISIILLHLFW